MKLSKLPIIIGIFIILIVGGITWMLKQTEQPAPLRKPVIYLYPTQQEMVSVKLNFSGQLTCTYPDYKNGWKVSASPDGTLTKNGEVQS